LRQEEVSLVISISVREGGVTKNPRAASHLKREVNRGKIRKILVHRRDGREKQEARKESRISIQRKN